VDESLERPRHEGGPRAALTRREKKNAAASRTGARHSVHCREDARGQLRSAFGAGAGVDWSAGSVVLLVLLELLELFDGADDVSLEFVLFILLLVSVLVLGVCD
jgi:hypothetical protein